MWVKNGGGKKVRGTKKSVKGNPFKFYKGNPFNFFDRELPLKLKIDEKSPKIDLFEIF